MKEFTPGPVLAVLNVRSGWADGSGCQAQLARRFKAGGVPLRVEQIRAGMDITEVVKSAVAEGVTAVIAGGGDGTLNAVAQGLHNSSVPMAILPIGTLNHLARDLRVPLDVNQAIDALEHSRPVTIDLGEVNGRVFLNNSIIGLYPAYRFARERGERRGFAKWRAIASAIYHVIRRRPILHVRLSVGGKELRRDTPYILVANNEHLMEGYRLGDRERIDQGQLWVYVMKPLSRWGMIGLALRILTGRFHKRDDFEVFPAESLRVASKRRRIGVALDGDVVKMRMPLEYRSLPGALQVLAPAAKAASQEA
jgi:diacylglycerol kinase family enzyme